MKYRCPYCRHELEKLSDPRCPYCGRFMTIKNALRNKATAVAAGEKHRARHRSIERIKRKYEYKKSELHGQLPPSLFRSPTFYLGVMVVFALVGAFLFSAADKSVETKKKSFQQRAMQHVDVLAEALGRYHFHVGSYPSQTQGLAALVRDPDVAKWNGPYINLLRKDPWNTAFVYEVNKGSVPTVFSCGLDKKRGTADDIMPDPECFDPGTEWTNGWVSAAERLSGVTILSEDPTSPKSEE